MDSISIDRALRYLSENKSVLKQYRPLLESLLQKAEGYSGSGSEYDENPQSQQRNCSRSRTRGSANESLPTSDLLQTPTPIINHAEELWKGIQTNLPRLWAIVQSGSELPYDVRRTEDVRVTFIQNVDGARRKRKLTFEDKIQRGIGQRSLAMEYDRQQKQSTVDRWVNRLMTEEGLTKGSFPAGGHNENVTEYIRQTGRYTKDSIWEKTAIKGTLSGRIFLTTERLLKKTLDGCRNIDACGLSCFSSLEISAFRAINIHELPGFIEILTHPGSILEFVDNNKVRQKKHVLDFLDEISVWYGKEFDKVHKSFLTDDSRLGNTRNTSTNDFTNESVPRPRNNKRTNNVSQQGSKRQRTQPDARNEEQVASQPPHASRESRHSQNHNQYPANTAIIPPTSQLSDDTSSSISGAGHEQSSNSSYSTDLTEDHGAEQSNAETSCPGGDEILQPVQSEGARSESTLPQTDASQAVASIPNPQQTANSAISFPRQPHAFPGNHRDEQRPVNDAFQVLNSSTSWPISHAQAMQPASVALEGNPSNQMQAAAPGTERLGQPHPQPFNYMSASDKSRSYDPSRVPLGTQAPFQESYNSRDVRTAVGGMGSRTGNEQHHQTHQPRIISSSVPSQNYLGMPVLHTTGRSSTNIQVSEPLNSSENTNDSSHIPLHNHVQSTSGYEIPDISSSTLDIDLWDLGNFGTDMELINATAEWDLWNQTSRNSSTQ